MLKFHKTILGYSLTIACAFGITNPQEEKIQDLDPYIIQAGVVANDSPLTTYTNLISLLSFDSQVDVQSRNFAEAQGDISIRGGVFENTGFTVGTLNIFDPQTGHYLAELPIDPMMLYRPEVLTGHANAVSAFNATVGSINYSWKPVSINQSQVQLSFGENGLNTQSFYSAFQLPSKNKSSGIDFGISRSESDGSIAFGDHNFKRISARYHSISETSKLTLFGGYQDKFFGWPNMYTPFNVQETEHTQTLLLMAEYSVELDPATQINLSAYYRENHDDYEYDRDHPGIYNPYEHETQVSSIHGDIRHTLGNDTEYYLTADLYFDSIESTTLTNAFQSRSYGKMQIGNQMNNLMDHLSLDFNFALTDTNRDAAMLSPSLRVEYDISQPKSTGSSILYFEYSRQTQVAGYTAIGSSPQGLFAGNPNLGVERSQNLEMGFERMSQRFAFQLATFFRMDRDLADWTYSFDQTNARTASPVDIDTFGIETQLMLNLGSGFISMGYTFLHKQNDYGTTSVDASFYALNYANHRFTLSLSYALLESLEIRLDNEFRIQEENLLRTSDDDAILTYASLVYTPAKDVPWSIIFSVENLWDEEFEEIPAVPASRRQFAFQTTYSW